MIKPIEFRLMMCVYGIIFTISLIYFFTLSEANADYVSADHGYECYNLEVSKAQLAHARSTKDKPMIRQARKAVRQRQTMCQG